jgi:hypothetical protein
MAIIPQNPNVTLARLNALEFPQRNGNTVAMSTIGDSCDRKLWFNLHWISEPEIINVRIKNLFATGTRAEDFIIKDLEKVDIKITNRQEEIWAAMGHAHGFTDGRANDVPEAPKTQHLLEIKTHNLKYFKKLQKEGIRVGFPKHYAQCQRYMKALKLKRTLYVGYCKDDSAYYTERLRYDPGYAADLVRKEEGIVLATVPPINKFHKGWFECTWCRHNQVCYENKPVAKNCRTCYNVDKAKDGKWICTLNGEHEIPHEVQLTGCDYHKPIKIV